MIDGFRTYQYYRSICLHFTNEKYNIFEHKGENRNTFESYIKRNDNKIFEYAGSLFNDDIQAIQFIAANVAYNCTNFIYKLTDESVDNYLLFLKRKESITNTFNEDLSKIELELEKGEINPFSFESNKIPLVYKLYMDKKISIETMYLLNRINGFLEIEHAKYKKEFLKIKKMVGFCRCDESKIISVFNRYNF